jgi:hypothetical protein
MVNWWRNALLKLRYPTVFCELYCTHLDTVLTNGKELILDVVKIITNAKKQYVEFSSIIEPILTKRKKNRNL